MSRWVGAEWAGPVCRVPVPRPLPVPPAASPQLRASMPASGPGRAPGTPGTPGTPGPGLLQHHVCPPRRTLTRAGVRLLPAGMCQQLPRLRVL